MSQQSPSTTLLIVAGISGGGKSLALKTFEDLGFYCLDNLPVELLPEVIRTIGNAHGRKLAIGIDQHHHSDLSQLPEWLSTLGTMGLTPQLVFFDADDDALIRRYADTRRRHPLTLPGRALVDTISTERELLRPLRALADLVIDTSALNIHELRRTLISKLGPSPTATASLPMLISCLTHAACRTRTGIRFCARCPGAMRRWPNISASSPRRKHFYPRSAPFWTYGCRSCSLIPATT